jgi:hypothetical protein
MSLTFESIRENIRHYHDPASHNRLLQLYDQFYKEREVKAAYIKNQYSTAAASIYYIFNKKGVIILTYDNNNQVIEEYECKLVSKKLTQTGINTPNYQLTLKFDNDIELIFDSVVDTSLTPDWVEEYADTIIDIYKKM